MQQCGQCGFKLTDAAIKMGYCPNCGSLLRVEGQQAPMSHVMEQRSFADANQGAAPFAQISPPTPVTTSQAQPLPPPVLPIAPGGKPTASPYTPERLSQPINPPPPPAVNEPNIPPSAALPPAPVASRRGGPGAAIAITILIVLLAAGGALFVAGRNGSGPLAEVVKGSSTTTAAAPTIPPTAIPTATLPAPTATAVPPTATPQPTVPSPPPNFTTFTSTDGTFGLNVPSDWAKTPVTSGTLTGTNFKSPLSTYELVAVDEAPSGSLDPQKIVTYVQSFATNSGGSNIAITQDATTTVIGQNSWMSAEATYQAGDGQHHMRGLAIAHGQNVYLFFYDALASGFQTDPGTKYDTMVKSFTFLH